VLENYVSLVEDNEFKCYIWLKILLPNDMPIFVVGCYIPHHDSNFYACLDRDQPFSNHEEDISYFKTKGEVIVLGDMNARTRNLQHDAQQLLMPHISRLKDDIEIYDHLSMDEKDPDKFEKLLLQMGNST
jgi:hypothetical protein